MRCLPRQQHAWSVLPPRCEHVSGLAPLQSALALMWSRLTAVVRNHSLVAPISMLAPRCGWRIIRPDRAIGRLQIVVKCLSRSDYYEDLDVTPTLADCTVGVFARASWVCCLRCTPPITADALWRVRL
jgi:hypothetical protein